MPVTKTPPHPRAPDTRRIGLLSDSHGRADTTRRAVRLLLDHHATCLIHLGDVGSAEVLDALLVPAPDVDHSTSDVPLEAHVVFGNTDWDDAALARYARDIGLHVDHPVGTLPLSAAGGGELVFCHGHEPAVLQSALARGARYLCHGHTHVAADTRRGRTRIINPGALFRAARHTVALLDTERDELMFLTVTAR